MRVDWISESSTNSRRDSISSSFSSITDISSRNSICSDTKKRGNANKVCRICGDVAYSYNFNCVSCESCKAFFRRNALRPKEFKCPFNGKCEVNIVSRRFCQKCRLEKCFKLGMKKELILTEEERELKNKMVREKRAKIKKEKENAERKKLEYALKNSSQSETSVDSKKKCVCKCNCGKYTNEIPLEEVLLSYIKIANEKNKIDYIEPSNFQKTLSYYKTLTPILSPIPSPDKISSNIQQSNYNIQHPTIPQSAQMIINNALTNFNINDFKKPAITLNNQLFNSLLARGAIKPLYVNNNVNNFSNNFY
ncbi:Nuclear hormone receptor HR96 [Strongyloides ratti]|uniref:Nuclear hormone receptor HR96 n=1 Tax=Strongyloides ratti TaxID=34506 RepID=A0A090L5R2_STRRB|nr:Nuclear hormone receptor HR96 [Strongyloides ratti]CEF63457.1 Nuclear hormone receptor HR96 [Strongyloides ratti]